MAESAVLSEGTVAGTEGTAGLKVIARDLVRAGIAGTIAGVLVAGIGGRLVMRLAAIAVPSSSGRFTENGNVIGDITLTGTMGLVVFVGLFFGASAAILWAVVSPWIPGRGAVRALLAMPVAVGLAGVALISGNNTDFGVLGFQPIVVAMLVGLVAALGLITAMLDTWLDVRLPPAGTESSSRRLAYTLLIVGGLLVMPIVVLGFFQPGGPVVVGFALVATGLATLAWWSRRLQGAVRPPRGLALFGQASLLAAVVVGIARLLPEIRRALGG